jgi:hypothetical protein
VVGGEWTDEKAGMLVSKGCNVLHLVCKRGLALKLVHSVQAPGNVDVVRRLHSYAHKTALRKLMDSGKVTSQADKDYLARLLLLLESESQTQFRGVFARVLQYNKLATSVGIAGNPSPSSVHFGLASCAWDLAFGTCCLRFDDMCPHRHRSSSRATPCAAWQVC